MLEEGWVTVMVIHRTYVNQRLLDSLVVSVPWYYLI